MRRIAHQDSDRADQAEINISPLIDVVFLLLIFFVVTTVFVDEAGVEINRPVAAAAAPLDKQSLQIALTANGGIFYGGREIPLNQVRGVIARALEGQARPVTVLADRAAATGDLLALMDECTRGGASRVSVAARSDGGP